jgi:hypothetical protein
MRREAVPSGRGSDLFADPKGSFGEAISQRDHFVTFGTERHHFVTGDGFAGLRST